MAVNLTNVLLEATSAPAAGRVEISDNRCVGLCFRVTAGGVRSWSFRFRDPLTGKLTRATIGAYPDISLADAREAAGVMRAQVSKGGNPVEIKRQARAQSGGKTFQALADRYLALIRNPDSERFKRSADQDDRNLKLHILPKWGKRQFAGITRGDVIELLDGLVAAGKPTLANRVHSLISAVFSFAVDVGLMAGNPCARLRKRGAERTGKRVLADDEIRLLWTIGAAPPVSELVGLALRLILITGCRPGEVAGAQKGELASVNRDADAALVLPGERTKNKRPHLVPLSRLAVETIQRAKVLSGDDSTAVFASRIEDDAAIAGHSLATAMNRFAEQLDAKGDPVRKRWRDDPPTPHDLRRTFSTRLASLGVAKELRDRLLNHIGGDVESRHYNLHDYSEQKRAALEMWCNVLAAILAVSAEAPASEAAE